jgi:outer membrane protein OmpA-like peptidoglycan-associated protein
VISSADIARAKAAGKKAELEKLQLKVAQNQRTYLEPFPSLTTSEALTPSLIPDPKSGVSLNTGSETINSSQSASVRIPARNLSLSRVAMDELKSRVRIMVTTTGIAVTPVNGFTGLVVVPVIGVVDGVETLVLNKVVVNPTPPKVQSFGPTSIKQSSIAWAPSTSQTIGYRVMINDNEICLTTANTCPVAELIGPKSVVTITSLGNDQTSSIPVVIPYAATRPIPALKVNFPVGSSLLSQAQKREIQSIAKVIDTQGFSRIVVSGFTDSSGSASLNRKLSQDRAKSVAAFMRTLLPKVAIKTSAFGPKKPLASNGSESGKAQNRRTEIATW